MAFQGLPELYQGFFKIATQITHLSSKTLSDQSLFNIKTWLVLFLFVFCFSLLKERLSF
jgi:hypothetical protein